MSDHDADDGVQRIEQHLYVHLQFDKPITLVLLNGEYSPPAKRAKLTLGEKEDMAGAITVDTTNETVAISYQDDKGNETTAPAGAIVTFTSDNPAAATVAVDASNPSQGDITPVAPGVANIGATLANADGTPVMEADGVTPFPDPAPVAVTVSPGAAVGDALTLSV